MAKASDVIIPFERFLTVSGTIIRGMKREGFRRT
jgi:hypothetical protein